MHDGASSHMSKATEAWLVKKLPKKINFTARSEWPPNSPDLNPIETLWSIMQDRVIELKAWTEVELCEVVQKAWWDIPQSTIDALCKSVPRRIKLMKANKGGRFKI